MKKKNSNIDQVFWLADAPLFIDSLQVKRFYDAVVRPDHEKGTTTLEITNEKESNLSANLELGAEIGPSKIFGSLISTFPFLDFKVTGKASGGFIRRKNKKQSHKVELHPISTPERQLIHLTFHYLINHKNRIDFVNDMSKEKWRKQQNIDEVPRKLVFLDLPSIEEAEKQKLQPTKIIPMAVEYDDGSVDLLYKSHAKKVGKDLPKYPFKAESIEKLSEDRNNYWKWFDENFDSNIQMEIVEESATKSKRKISWINFRISIDSSGDTLHLHFRPDGKYYTGDFAYNLIQRGYKNGLRIIGKLKSGPSLNVLAIYEK